MTWMPFDMSVVSAGGMSCYGITGIFMMEAYGLEGGEYGFLVKVIWRFLDVLFVPVLVKISKGSLTVGGAAGNMDNMLGLMMKFVGVRLVAFGVRQGADVCGAVFVAADGGVRERGCLR